MSDSVKLAAIKDALDRGGLGAKTEVEITAKPYEAILDGIGDIKSGSRAEFRRSRGIEDQPHHALAENYELPACENYSIVDTQVLDDDGLKRPGNHGGS